VFDEPKINGNLK